MAHTENPNVEHPSHYNQYPIEVIDMMERIFGTEATDPDQKQAFKNLTALIEQTLEMKQSQAVLAFNDFLAMLNNAGVFSYEKCCEYMKEFQKRIE